MRMDELWTVRAPCVSNPRYYQGVAPPQPLCGRLGVEGRQMGKEAERQTDDSDRFRFIVVKMLGQRRFCSDMRLQSTEPEKSREGRMCKWV